ncbi:MAG: diguanylate cyclase, partial [Gammaproteobacteria bacterium]
MEKYLLLSILSKQKKSMVFGCLLPAFVRWKDNAMNEREYQLVKQLRSTLSKMELSLDAIDDAIVWLDKAGNIQWCNERFAQLNNRLPIEILGQSIHQLMQLKKQDIIVPWKEIQKYANIYELEKNNEIFLLEVSCCQFHQVDEETNIVMVLHDVTARKKAEKELIYLSHHDMLTSLYNRPAFEEALRKEITKSYQDKTSFAVLLLDLDNFKTVNDTFGHHVGDQLLITVAKQLQDSVRKEDFVARLGGDEFIIILSNIKDMKDVSALAKKLVARFNKPFKLESHYFHATVSIGIAIAPSEDI